MSVMTIYDGRPRLTVAVAVVAVVAWVAAYGLVGPGSYWVTASRYATGGLSVVAAITLLGLRLWGRGPRPAYCSVREGRGFLVPASGAYTAFVTGEVLLAGFFTDRVVTAWSEPVDGTVTQVAVSWWITVGMTVLVVLLD